MCVLRLSFVFPIWRIIFLPCFPTFIISILFPNYRKDVVCWYKDLLVYNCKCWHLLFLPTRTLGLALLSELWTVNCSFIWILFIKNVFKQNKLLHIFWQSKHIPSKIAECGVWTFTSFLGVKLVSVHSEFLDSFPENEKIHAWFKPQTVFFFKSFRSHFFDEWLIYWT